jgi:hypothetical protein
MRTTKTEVPVIVRGIWMAALLMELTALLEG